MLTADLDAPRKQRHTVTRIYHRLMDEHGMADVSYPVVRAYVADRKPQVRAEAGRGPTEVFVPQSHRPGDEAEVDLGEVVVRLAGQDVGCFMLPAAVALREGRCTGSRCRAGRRRSSRATSTRSPSWAIMRVSITQPPSGSGKDGGVARRGAPMVWTPCLVRSADPGDRVPVRLGDPLVDEYLEFVAARCGPNTVLATACDLKVFFSVVGKEPPRVSTADVFAFLAAQRAPRRGPRVVRLEDRETGLSARMIKRRLASVSGLFAYLLARGDVGVRRHPVPRGLATRRPQAPGMRGLPLLRTPRTLPRVLAPAEVDALLGERRRELGRGVVADVPGRVELVDRADQLHAERGLDLRGLSGLQEPHAGRPSAHALVLELPRVAGQRLLNHGPALHHSQA
jgi:Phage integrase, N-terminal SAM-like domain